MERKRGRGGLKKTIEEKSAKEEGGDRGRKEERERGEDGRTGGQRGVWVGR